MSEYARRTRPVAGSYLPPRARLQAIPDFVLMATPQPGTGTVFVDDFGDGEWRASWQAGASTAEYAGTRDGALEWARRCDTPTRLVFDDGAGRYLPIDC